MNLRFVGFLAAAALAAATAPAGALALEDLSTGKVTFSDGAVATGYDHCGEGDLCARILYQDGDELRFYSEGAGAGQPYVVHVVRVHGTRSIFEYSRRLENVGTTLTLDHGLAQLSAFLNRDGTLRFVFNPVAK